MAIKKYNYICVVIIMINFLVMFNGCGIKVSDPLVVEDSKEYLYIAISGKNLEAVKECVENGVDINKTFGGYPIIKEVNPLSVALTDAPNQHIVKYLLDKGADVNYTDSKNISLLMYVSGARFSTHDPINGSVFYCKLLLEYGAKVNQKGKDGYTALDFAAKAGNMDIVQLLLDKGAIVNESTLSIVMKGQYGYGYCNYGLVRKILQESLENKIKIRLNPALQAAILGDSERVVELVKKDEGDFTEIEKKQILFNTAAFCDSKTLEYIANKGFDMHYIDDDEQNLILVASKYGNLENVKYLLSKGFNNNLSGTETPLYEAIEGNYYDVAEYLMKSGAKLDIEQNELKNNRDYDGNPIDPVVKNGNINMLELIAKNGYPLTDFTKILAMKAAIKDNRLNVLEYLLNKNINIESKNSILDEGCSKGNFYAIKVLVEQGANVKSKYAPLTSASTQGYYEIVKFLIDKGADVNAVEIYPDGSEGSPPLMIATSYGYFNIVRLLVDHGANLEYQYWESKSTVIIEAAGTSYNILQYYIEKGANINYQNAEGETSLMRAVVSGRKKNVELLLKSGADVSLKNKDGLTALDLARKDKNRVLISMLEKKR